MSTKKPLLAYFGHHKAATTWIHSTISSACGEAGLKHVVVHNSKMFGHDLQSFVDEHNVDFLSYINADSMFTKSLEEYKAFHVVRDLRDTCVSAYYSHLNSHPLDPEFWPQLEQIRAQLEGMSPEDGLRLEIDLLEWQANLLRKWDYQNPQVMELKMEALVASPYQEIFEFLGLLDDKPLTGRERAKHLASITAGRIMPGKQRRLSGFGTELPPERLLGIVWEQSFQRKAAGRKRGEENRQSHYRKGKPGDWRNHFTDELKTVFKDKYNDVLIQLGYEANDDW